LFKAARHRLKPTFLPLEDRRLLSTYTVTSTADDGSAGTLRWAVAQANEATSPTTINFNLGGPAAITFQQADEAIDLTNISPVTIDGPGAEQLVISGNNESGVFQLDDGGTATISGLAIIEASASYSAINDLGSLSGPALTLDRLSNLGRVPLA
jgi:hypothetical protein